MNAYEQAILKKGLTESHWKILRRIPPRSRVLEVGPSVGHMSRWLKEQNRCNVIGIENDPEMADKAGKYCGKLYIGSVEDRVLLKRVRDDNGPFDCVIFSDVLEHLMAPEKTLTNITTLINRQGKLLASIPNVAHFSVRARLLLGRFDYQSTGLLDRNHVRFFTKKTTLELFHSAGYEVTDFDVTIRALPFKRFFRLLPGLCGYQFIIEGTPKS